MLGLSGEIVDDEPCVREGPVGPVSGNVPPTSAVEQKALAERGKKKLGKGGVLLPYFG